MSARTRTLSIAGVGTSRPIRNGTLTSGTAARVQFAVYALAASSLARSAQSASSSFGDKALAEPGRKFHTKVVVTRDGKPHYRSEVSMPREVEKPDPKLFDKPEPKP